MVYLTISTLLNNIVELSCCLDFNAFSWVKRDVNSVTRALAKFVYANRIFFFFFFLFNEYRALKYIYGTLLWGIGIGKELILSDPDTEFHAYLIKIHQARKSEKVSDSTLFTFHIIIMLGIIANFTSNTNILELSESLVHKHDTTKLERKKKTRFC